MKVKNLCRNVQFLSKKQEEKESPEYIEFIQSSVVYKNMKYVIPIPECNGRRRECVERILSYRKWLKENETPTVNCYISNSDVSSLFELIQNAMALELFFPEEFSKNDTSIFESFLDEEFPPLSDEIPTLITNAFDFFMRPESEIRNRLILYALRSKLLTAVNSRGIAFYIDHVKLFK